MAGGRKEYELLFKLQAKLGANFTSTFAKAANTTKQLQNKVSGLQSVTGKISAFQKQEAALESNRQKLARLTTEHGRLKQKMSETEAPSEALRQKLARNEQQIAQTTAKIEEQEARLRFLGSELKNAGIDTANLGEENRRLAETYEKLRKSQEDIAKINTAIAVNNEAITKTKTQLTGTIATAAAIGAAIYAGPVKSSMEFESAMADVVKVVDGLKSDTSGELTQEYYQMADAVKMLSLEVPVTATELAKIAAAAGQAGLARNEIVQFTADAAKMGIAFDISAQQAGEWMATWRTSFGMSQDEVVALSDKINALSNVMATDAIKISSVVTKIGPLGEIAGFASGEIAAMGATLTAVGVNEDVAATGIKKMITTMTAGTAATARQKAVLDKLGFSATDLAERMQVDAKGAVLDFLGAVKQLPQAEQTSILKQYFGEESIAAIAPMVQKMDLLSKSFGITGNEAQYAGSMLKEFLSRSSTDGEKIQVFQNALNALSITIGDALRPAVAETAAKLTELIIKVIEFAEANPELIQTIAKVTAGLFALRAAALVGKLAFLDIRGVVLDVQKVMALFRGKAVLAGVEAASFGTKLKAVASGILKDFTGIEIGANKTGKSVSKMFSETKLGGALSKIGGAFSGGFTAVFSGVGGKTSKAFSGIPATISGIFGKAGNMVAAGPLGKIGETVAKGFGKIAPVLAPIGKVAGTVLKPLIGIASKFLPVVGVITLVIGAVQTLVNNLGKVRSVIENIFGSSGVAVFDSVVSAISNIKNVIQGIINGEGIGAAEGIVNKLFGDSAPQVISSFVGLVQSVYGVLSTLYSFVSTVIFPIIQTVFSFIIGTVIPMVAQGISSGATTIMSILQTLIGIVTTVAGVILQVIQFFLPIIQSVVGTALSVIMDVISGALQMIQGLIQVFGGIFQGNWSQIWAGVKTILSGAWDSMTSIARGALNGIISLVNGAISALNKIKIPDWVPLVGGKGVNIPLIPKFARGTKHTPDTFIAGEAGAELVTGARNRTVFTAAETGNIFRNVINAVKALNSGIILPSLQYAPAPAGVAPNIVTPERPHTSFTIHSAPVFHVGNNAKAEEIEEMLRKHDEELLREIEERERQQEEDRRRRRYD